MRTQLHTQNEKHWVKFATIAILIAYSLIAVAYGYYTLLEMVTKNGWPFAQLIALLMLLLCFIPGVLLWKFLRPRNKYAALYGLLVTAVCCTSPYLLK